MSARMIVACSAAFAIAASTLAANAALAPNYQRARELAAVVDAVAARVETHPIDQVSYEGDFRYRATAGPCTMSATIVPVDTPGIAGPLKFEVELAEPACGE